MNERRTPVVHRGRGRTGLPFAVLAVTVAMIAWSGDPSRGNAQDVAQAAGIASVAAAAVDNSIEARRQGDLAAMETFRPGYSFWQHIFTIPDGSIAYGSAVDGRLLAIFPASNKSDWTSAGVWIDKTYANVLDGQDLPAKLDDRRDYVAYLLEQAAGPVVHNPTRGRFVQPNEQRYGAFLEEWAAIYERFGVPAEIGLAQVLIESGFNGTRRSEAGAVGFCQWLGRNWKALDKIAPAVIESGNQTTQAQYCAAYLTVLATKYGSFIPALSEHHSGGTNVGRTLINGERLGGGDIRERYFLGSQFARDLRTIAPEQFSDLYRTYGPRSFRYAEMAFGNTYNVRRIIAAKKQQEIFAMRTMRAIPVAEITRRTRLTADEIRRFNPALTKKVPAGATLYLPVHVREFGRDVAFWHRPASAQYQAVLDDFLGLSATDAQWDDPAFESVLRVFQRKFQATNTEEGNVMATILAYTIQETYSSERGEILDEFRHSDDIRQLFDRAVSERESSRARASRSTGE